MPVLVFPVFHPAAALYTPANRAILQEDFQRLRRLLELGSDALVTDRSSALEGTAAPSPSTVPLPPTEAEAPPADAPPADAFSAPPTRREDAGRVEQLPLW